MGPFSVFCMAISTDRAAVSTEITDSVSGVLAAARAARRVADSAEVELFELAATWADMHSPEAAAGTPAAYFYGIEEISPVADGVPEFTAWAAADFGASIGLSSEAGTRLIADALETRHRLPRLWTRVTAGEVQVWRARRIAQETSTLPADGAEFVDRQVAPFAHSVGVAQLDRLIAEARVRFDPETAEAQRVAATEDRFFTIDHEQVTFTGSSEVHGLLDLADALELERAVATGAEELKTLGSEDTLDVRRAHAVGVMARGQLAFGFTGDAGAAESSRVPQAEGTGIDEFAESPRVPRGGRAPRHLELVVHTTAEALAGLAGQGAGNGNGAANPSPRPSDGDGDGLGSIGRCGNTGTPVLMTQVRDWLQAPDLKLHVRPVIDLADVTPVDRYEIPDRMSRAVEERDVVCVFPWCHHRAGSCDKDHVIPYNHDDPASGGETSLGNLAPLCRRHHRLKTAGLWSYKVIQPGTYEWTDRFGNTYQRDPAGTGPPEPETG